MKITKLFLALFVCFALVSCCVTPAPLPPEQIIVEKIIYKQREPVTLEIIHDIQIKNIMDKADFHLSTSIDVFFPSLVENRDIVGGAYVRQPDTNNDRVTILRDSPGKFVSIVDNEQRINISFENIILSFVKISGNQVYHYELDSAVRNNNNLQIFFQYDKPYLVINTDEKPSDDIIPAQGIPRRVDTSQSIPNNDQLIANNNQLITNNSQSIPNNQLIANNNQSNNSTPPPIPFNNLDVLGRASLTIDHKDAIVDFICAQRNPVIPSRGSGFDRSSVVQIIEYYFEEAGREGINTDLAIAQVMQNLQYFSETKEYKDFREAHNYGKLIIANNIRNAYWDGKGFTGRNISERRRNGIRAHIQFLKRLASGNLQSGYPVVLPSQIWRALDNAAGSKKTLNDIAQSSWGGQGYADDVRDKYNKLIAYVTGNRA